MSKGDEDTMKTFKAQKLAMILLLVVMVIVAGCSGNSGSSSGGSSGSSSGSQAAQSQGSSQNTDASQSSNSSDAGAGEASPGRDHWKRDLVLGAGSMGGVYYILSGAIADLLMQKVDGIDNVTVLTGTSAEFMVNMDAGKVDMSFNTPDAMYFAWSDEEGQGFGQGERYEKVRFFAATYVNIMDLVVLEKSGIKSVEDIGDKKVAVLSATLSEPMELYLKAHGIENPNVVIINDWNQMAQALRDGSIAALQGIAAHPMSALTELGNSVELRLIPYSSEEAVDKFLDNSVTRFFQRVVQPAGTYDWQKEDYTTVGRGTTLSVSADMPEDQVYEIVKTIYENVDELTKVHPMAKDFTIEMMQTYMDAGVVRVPLHPGVRRYFEENGVNIPATVPQI